MKDCAKDHPANFVQAVISNHSENGILLCERNRPCSMRRMLIILWNALVNAYDAAFMIIITNIFSVILCIPVITIPLAAAGLFYTNFQIASGESVEWKTYFEGIKQHWWTGIRWTVVNGIVLFSLTFYFFFFLDREEIWAAALTGLVLGTMAIWILMMFLTFPMMMIQEKPSLLSSLRNSLVFILRWPGFSFTFLLPVILLLIVTLIFPPLGIFLSLGLVAYLCSYAVYYRIESDRHPELFTDPRQSR
jgi:hypothetical protein